MWHSIIFLTTFQGWIHNSWHFWSLERKYSGVKFLDQHILARECTHTSEIFFSSLETIMNIKKNLQRYDPKPTEKSSHLFQNVIWICLHFLTEGIHSLCWVGYVEIQGNTEASISVSCSFRKQSSLGEGPTVFWVSVIVLFTTVVTQDAPYPAGILGLASHELCV